MRAITKNKEINLSKITIRVLAIIFWMGFIFYLSNQPATVSASQSGSFRKMIIEMPILGVITKPILTSSIGEFFIRKSAHMFLYFVLAILTYSLVYNGIYHRNSQKILNSMIISLIVVFLYACTDEFHQLFIPGRSGEFRDIMVDTLGGIIGLILIGITNLFLGKSKVKN
ncbi:VanZ family protein [Romboutsia sp. 1001713B170207_170306_H8]|uniref:VanZ family protein n=1 Tax=Romboutsia sp. 1001713B170207_170306_H8 TaxID=2787112 RepID=UPI0008223CA1|nr:VanZ family protein [Romboutsia sp. 1001713B170207_170306_H8]SCI49590.1 Predicted integral membrane protein [uncultured Clostridium sp.]